MTRPASHFSALVQSVQGTMNQVKDVLGLPRSVTLLGIIRACPILVFLVVLIVVAGTVIVFA